MKTPGVASSNLPALRRVYRPPGEVTKPSPKLAPEPATIPWDEPESLEAKDLRERGEKLLEAGGHVMGVNLLLEAGMAVAEIRFLNRKVAQRILRSLALKNK